MSISFKRWLATGFVVALTAFSIAPGAQAADTEAANKAAEYLVTQLVGGDHFESEFGNESITADAVLALVAAGNPDHLDEIQAIAEYLKKAAPTYATTGGEAAAKLLVVAQTVGADPKDFGGVNLLEMVQAAIADDGSFGSYKGSYSSGWGLVALARAGENDNAKMANWLISQAEPDGSFSYEKGQPGDPDMTSMAIIGLSSLQNRSEEATNALESAEKWAADTQQADGSWAGMATVNSTAVLGSALKGTPEAQAKAEAYLTSVQTADGSLPATTGGTEADVLATAQAILLLSGKSYLDLPTLPAQTGEVTPTPNPSTAPTPVTPDTPAAPLESGMPVWAYVGIAAAVIVIVAVITALVRGKKKP